MIFLDLDDLLHIAQRALGGPPQIRDVGLLQSALSRPQATMLGDHAYVSIHTKAAALLLSLTKNHGLVDGNKRLGLAAVLAFYGMNGSRLTLTNDEAFDLVMAVASGDLTEVDGVAGTLRRAAQPWA